MLTTATFCLSLLCLANSLSDSSPQLFTKTSTVQIKEVQRREYSTSDFRPTVAYKEDDDDFDVAATQVRRPAFPDENYPLQNSIPVANLRPLSRPPQAQPLLNSKRPQQFKQPIEENSNQVHQSRPLPRLHTGYPKRPLGTPQQFKPQIVEEKKKSEEEEEEEKEEEPDRLSILLPQSKFDCVGKNTGYYADENLGCEVFHYCHDNAKHSWICPDGFTFHQVHLICMPPGADNICEKSSQFHFVNEYLYKPVNLEEHQNKPNVSLRYSERYYPNSQYNGNEDYDEEEPQPSKIPIKVQAAPSRRPAPSPFSPSSGLVFRSPEEINIPLQQRRPQYSPSRLSLRDDSDF